MEERGKRCKNLLHKSCQVNYLVWLPVLCYAESLKQNGRQKSNSTCPSHKITKHYVTLYFET